MFTSTLLRSLACATLILGLTLAAAAAPVVSNREPSDLEVGYLPAADSVPTVNPPAISWLDEPDATTWTLQIARDRDFADVAVEKTDWPWLLYTHNEPFPAGDYFWRYRYLDKDGAQSDWSAVRRFTIGPDAENFPRPSAAEIRAAVPAGHPRMFTRPETVADLRASAQTSSTEIQSLLKTADSYLSYPLMDEPKPWTDGKWNMEEWRGYLREASATTNRVNVIAFAYLLTGDEKYSKRAHEHVMNFVSWDPDGPSNMRINDEVGMPILYTVSRCYDWLHPILSDDDKKQIIDTMRARGEEAYHRMSGRPRPYEQFAFNSHFGRMWHFLGEAGVAFYDEIPEAETWLNYATTIYYGWYPLWGTSDGGWAEGMWYWSSYNQRVTWWIDLMRESLQMDAAAKPFYAKIGDFPLYVCPPGSVVGGFGDFAERVAPLSGLARTMGSFALYRQNSEWQWYADTVGSTSTAVGPFEYLHSRLEKPEPRKPTNLPLLKAFTQSGYGLFHSDMLNAENNIHLAMRASPFGNISHSHNDQNAIIMSAFGEPLLVNTGLRDYYGSEFSKKYYWHTKSHNALLIGGQGQKRGQGTDAEFVAQGETDDMAWLVGDATAAFGDGVKLYRRWVIFLPKHGAVIVDEVDAEADDITLLYHGRAPFTTDDDAGQFNLEKGNARLRGQIIVPGRDDAIAFKQTDEYPLPLNEGVDPLFDEWHLSAPLKINRDGDAPFYVVSTLEVGGRPSDRAIPDTDWSVEKSDGKLRIVGDMGDTGKLDLTIDPAQLSVTRNPGS